MHIALIVTKTTPGHSSHLIALELDERLQGMGHEPTIVDLTDPSYQIKDLDDFDTFILITTHEGPLYNCETHRLLTTHKHAYRGKPTATVMISNEPILAESADTSLRRILKSLGAELFAPKLLVNEETEKFDLTLKLIDRDLEEEIGQFLADFFPGESVLSPKALSVSA